MKTKELIDMVLDLCKLSSDDAFFTEEHVQWLLNKNRAFILRKEKERLEDRLKDKLNQTEPDMNSQTICVDLEKTKTLCGDPCSEGYLRSVQKIPDTIGSGFPTITPMDYFSSNISFVPFEKMKYIGFNKYLNNIIFCSIGPDDYVYLKSSNPMFENLGRIRITGVFDDFNEAQKLSCDCDSNDDGNDCDPFQAEFPIDSYLVPELIDMVMRQLLGASYRPKDNTNNANDDLSEIATFIRNYVKKPLQRQIEGTEED